MKQMLKEAAILFIITIIAGLALGYVYQLTKGPIDKQNEIKLKEAYRAVFPQAESFADDETFSSEKAETILRNYDKEHDYSGSVIEKFSFAYDSNNSLIGYVITVTNSEGFNGNITFSMGIKLDGTMNGISITSISETAGLGMKAPEVLAPQFENKSTSSRFVVTKNGAVYDNEIDAITSATITSKAVTSGVNAGVAYYRYYVEEGSGNE